MTNETMSEIKEKAKAQTYDQLEKWETMIEMTDRFEPDDFMALKIIRDEMAKRKGSEY